MGAVTSFSAGEAAAAQLELAKAGLDSTAIMDAMPGVLSLAAAGNMDVATAAGIAASAVNTFGLEASAVTGVANMLAAAANASSADVSDLAAGFQMSASVFAANGQSMADLTTAMSLMANAGIAGSDAGTSLKTMMMRLAAPTDEAAAAMGALGLSVYNADGSMRPFEDVVADIGTATAGMSDAQRNAAFSTIFGADAIRAATILTSAGADSWDAMEASVTAAGAAEAAAGARMRGLNGAMETFRGAIESVMIAISARFLPVLTEMIQGAATLVGGLTTLSPELQNAAIAFAAVLAAAGPLMLAISGVGAALGFILSPVGLIVIGVAALGAAWASNFGGIQEITAAAVAQVVPALQSVLTPLQAVAAAMATTGVNSAETNAAITTLPAILQPAATGFQTLWATITGLGATLATFFAPAIGRLQEAFAGMPEAFAPLLPKLQELGGAFGGLLTALQPFVALIGAGLAIAVDFGVNRLTTVISSLPSILGPIIDQVTAIIRLITTILTEVVAGVKAAIDGDWTAVWESAKAIIEGFSTFFRGLFSRLGVFMGAVARNIAEPIINTLRDLGVDITPLLDGVRKTFEDVWAKVLTYIQPVIDLVGTLTDVIGKFKDFLGSLNLPNPFAGLASAADAVRNAIGEFGGGVIEGFTGQPATEDGNAGGTSYFPGGATAINERGYEQVVLPAGSRVYTNGQTNNRQGNEERTININLGGVTVNSPMDAHRLGGMLRDQLAMAGV